MPEGATVPHPFDSGDALLQRDGQAGLVHPLLAQLPRRADHEGGLAHLAGSEHVAKLAAAQTLEEIPIGLALTWVAGDLSPHDHQRASALAAQALVTWVNYPELGKARGRFDIPQFAVDDRWQRLEGIVAVDREAEREVRVSRDDLLALRPIRPGGVDLPGGAGEPG